MEWIKPDDERKPEFNREYWVTTIFYMNPVVVEALYAKNGKWYLMNANSRGREIEVDGWWNSPKPKPMLVTKEKPFIVFPECEVNEKGINKKIKANLLDDKKMRELGFFDHREGYWHLMRGVAEDITFGLTINKTDPNDFNINVLDDNFCQPYDYQSSLSKETYHGPSPFAIKVYHNVEKIMKWLTECGVISGHVKGEYI